MEKNRSLAGYRAVDLVLFAVMLAVFESIAVLAALRWFPGQPYTVSLTPLVVAMVLVRWGPWAGIHAVLGGAVLCFWSRALPSQFVIYCVGNCFSLLLLPLLQKWRKEEGIWHSGVKALSFGAGVLLLMQAGRALLSLLLGADVASLPRVFTTEVITDLFTLVVLWIVRRLDGMLEDQRHYLRRVREEARAGG